MKKLLLLLPLFCGCSYELPSRGVYQMQTLIVGHNGNPDEPWVETIMEAKDWERYYGEGTGIPEDCVIYANRCYGFLPTSVEIWEMPRQGEMIVVKTVSELDPYDDCVRVRGLKSEGTYIIRTRWKKRFPTATFEQFARSKHPSMIQPFPDETKK
jgi:hypothetical protein